MSVDFYWRRVPDPVLSELSPRELDGLIPFRFDAEYEPLVERGLLLSVVNLDALMSFTLTRGASGRTDEDDCAVYGAAEVRVEGEEDPDYGFVGVEVFVRTADAVRAAAESLRDLPYEAWVRGWDTELAAEAAFVGKGNLTWEQDDADRIVRGLDRLRDFYDEAARAGDAVVSKVIA
ncbi:DUF1877 family protein [Embleya sp. NPDC056575]|uniref:DUF1877 family protein n=1 Tax=unclassified Embleya TaxID=2699296 RepID=UPI0036A46639